MIYVRWQDREGDWYDQPYIMVDAGTFYPLRRTRSDEYDELRALFAADMQRMKPLKVQMPLVGNYPDYITYTDNCRQLEQGRAIYTVKPDVPLSFIQPDILVACARESFPPNAVPHEQMDSIIDALYAVHVQRFNNFFEKKKLTCIIFSRDHMEHFARTGRQSDHFFALRPYTPAERVQILENIRAQAEANPNFEVHFFREDVNPPLTEIGLYEGAGTLMTKPFTDYDLLDDHAEAIITQSAFCERYKAFFFEYLLVQCVMEKEETLRELDRLIEIAGRAR